MRRSDVSARVFYALRSGPMTFVDVAKLVSIPNESARQCLTRLNKLGHVRVVGKKKMPCHVMPGGRPMNVYEVNSATESA